MVDLEHESETVALDPLHHPQFPQWFGTVQLLGEQSSHHRAQLSFAARLRQADVPDVVVQVEMLVVDPYRVFFDRHPGEVLAVPGDVLQFRLDESPDLVDVDAAVGPGQRGGVENGGTRYVHMGRG